MGMLSRTVQVVLICLAAVGTLFAGMPHVNCLCPNGQQKQFCFGSIAKESKCCCGGGCCSVDLDRPCCSKSVASQRAAGSCCEQAAEKNSASTGSDGKVTGSCCKKTVADGEPVVVAPVNSPTARDLTSNLATPLFSLAPPLNSLNAGRILSRYRSDHSPPPTDLVITLQHFVI